MTVWLLFVAGFAAGVAVMLWVAWLRTPPVGPTLISVREGDAVRVNGGVDDGRIGVVSDATDGTHAVEVRPGVFVRCSLSLIP